MQRVSDDNTRVAGGDPLDFAAIIAPERWQDPGDYFQTMPATLRGAVGTVVESDARLREEIRRELPRMERAGRILARGKADPDLIALTQRKYLYPGKVIAVDGTNVPYETLSMVSAQIGVIRVGYQGTTGTIVTQIRNCGLAVPRTATRDEFMAALTSRTKLKNDLPKQYVTAIRNYKERELMLEAGPDVFKIGHGALFPYEMLIGGGRRHILQTCLGLIGRLIEDGAYAMFVSQTSDEQIQLMGLALDAGEYLIVDSGTDVLNHFLYGDSTDGELRAHFTHAEQPSYGYKSQIQVFEEFRDTYGPRVVRGILRAHQAAPAFVFYCNADRIDQAVHTLFADAMNTGARGFPLLIDYADQMCSGTFKAGDFSDQVAAEFARATGGSGIYAPERATRDYSK